MLSVAPNCITRSSLEEMLEALQRRDEREMPRDVPPALPRRAVSRSRLPSAKRRLPVSSEADAIRRRSSEFLQKRRKSSEFFVDEGKMRGHGGNGFRDEKDREMESGEWFYFAAASNEKRMGESTPNKASYFVGKIGALEDSRQQILQDMPEVQKGLHDHQHLHELNEVAVTLQSYVRGEIARKEYSALLRMKNQDNYEKLDEVMAIVKLQSVIRGWLTQRHFIHLQKLIQTTNGKVKSGISISEVKNLAPEMLPLFVEVLQKRVSMAEATLELKEKGIASLREQAQQHEARLKESEAKMKSVEEMSQKQITSLQKDLTAAEKNAVAKSNAGQPAQRDGRRSPHSYRNTNEGLNHRSNGVKELEKKKVTFEDEGLTMVDVKSRRSHLVIIPIEKLQRLKRMIKAWIKDNKVRLRDSKTKIHSMGHTEADGHWRTWWGKKAKRS